MAHYKCAEITFPYWRTSKLAVNNAKRAKDIRDKNSRTNSEGGSGPILWQSVEKLLRDAFFNKLPRVPRAVH